MSESDKLNDMIQSLIDDNIERAQVDFHEYLIDKIKRNDIETDVD